MYTLWEIRAKKDKKHKSHSPKQKPETIGPSGPDSSKSKQDFNSPVGPRGHKNSAKNKSNLASPKPDSAGTETQEQNSEKRNSQERSRNPFVGSETAGNDSGETNKISW